MADLELALFRVGLEPCTSNVRHHEFRSLDHWLVNRFFAVDADLVTAFADPFAFGTVPAVSDAAAPNTDEEDADVAAAAVVAALFVNDGLTRRPRVRKWCTRVRAVAMSVGCFSCSRFKSFWSLASRMKSILSWLINSDTMSLAVLALRKNGSDLCVAQAW